MWHTHSILLQSKSLSAVIKRLYNIKKNKRNRSLIGQHLRWSKSFDLNLYTRMCVKTYTHVSSLKTGSAFQEERREGQESTNKPIFHLALPKSSKTSAFFSLKAWNRVLFLDIFYAVAGRNLEACLAGWKSSCAFRMRVYYVLAYFCTEYFDAGTPDLNVLVVLEGI